MDKERKMREKERERRKRRPKRGKEKEKEGLKRKKEGERKKSRKKVRRKRGKGTIVEKEWNRCRAEVKGSERENRYEKVYNRRPWVEVKGVKTSGKRKSRVHGVSKDRGEYRRGSWRRREGKKRSEKGGVARWKGRRVERRSTGKNREREGNQEGVLGQRDNRYKQVKQNR